MSKILRHRLARGHCDFPFIALKMRVSQSLRLSTCVFVISEDSSAAVFTLPRPTRIHYSRNARLNEKGRTCDSHPKGPCPAVARARQRSKEWSQCAPYIFLDVFVAIL